MSNNHEYLEKNDEALAANIADHRDEVNLRLATLENELAKIKSLVQGQSKVIGDTLQQVMGHGSTVTDPNPEDTR